MRAVPEASRHGWRYQQAADEMKFALFVIVTMIADWVIASLYSTNVTGPFAIVGFYLLMAVMSVLRADWVYRHCPASKYSAAFVWIMAGTSFASLFMLSITSSVAFAITSSYPIDDKSLLSQVYYFAYNWFGNLTVILTGAELLTVFMDRIENYRESRTAKNIVASRRRGLHAMATGRDNTSVQGALSE